MQQWSRALCRLVLVVMLLPALPALAADPWQVAVQKAAVRQTPQVFGKIVSNLSYGTTVEVLAEQKGWLKVRIVGGTGWLHQSAVAHKVTPLQAGSKKATVSASQQELTLAGKGFNSQVENAYRQKNRAIDFSWIDRMEKMTVDDAQLQKFLQSGGLAGGAHAN